MSKANTDVNVAETTTVTKHLHILAHLLSHVLVALQVRIIKTPCQRITPLPENIQARVNAVFL